MIKKNTLNRCKKQQHFTQRYNQNQQMEEGQTITLPKGKKDKRTKNDLKNITIKS